MSLILEMARRQDYVSWSNDEGSGAFDMVVHMWLGSLELMRPIDSNDVWIGLRRSMQQLIAITLTAGVS